MTDITAEQSPPKLAPDVLRPLRWGAAVAWISWLLSVGLLLAEQQLWVVHPWPLPFLVLLVVTLGAAVTSPVLGFWRVLRGPRRRAALAWTASALLPALVWVFLGVYAYRNGERHYQPHNLPMTLMTRMGHNLMEAQAVCLYPYRLETDRLVMFYGESVTDPDGDIRAMDRHVAHLEEATGLPLRAKIHWVRGQLLGRGGLCVYGITMGSNESPAEHLDRHELAHAVETQHGSSYRDLPTLLGEGWAESQSVDGVTLAARALRYRRIIDETGKEWGKLSESERAEIVSHMVEPRGQERLFQKVWQDGPAVCYLRELTDSFWYHRHTGPVYSVGGAFVNFLVQRYGAKRFMDFYFACRPGTFEANCHRAYGTDLEKLEKEFWADAEKLAGIPLSTKKTKATVGTVMAESVKPSVTLEFRLAEANPAEGLTEVTVAGTARKIYLHKEQGVTNKDIAEARATFGEEMRPAVMITLTEDGRRKMAKLTEHKGKLLAILVDGKVISAPVVRSTISDKEASFNVGTTAEAEKIANGLNKK